MPKKNGSVNENAKSLNAEKTVGVAQPTNAKGVLNSDSPNDSKRFNPTDDSIFKVFMTEKEFAIAWIQEYLPQLAELVDLDQLEVEKGDYYDDALRMRVSDVVYSVRFRNAPGYAKLFIILEHKGQSSKAVNRVAIAQALAYVSNQCLKAARAATAKETLPQPIPVIVYTGANSALETIRWRDAFPLPSELAEYAFDFRPVFINMTRMRLNGKLPSNPFLRVLYNTMTRHSVRDLDGFEEREFQPLNALPDKLSPEQQSRVNSLLLLYSTRVKNLPPETRRERFETLCRSINLEEKMGKDVLYEFFAPKAEQWGIEKGREEERKEILSSQRQTLSATILNRFGSCPTTLKRALGKIRDVDALINLRLFAVTEAKSIDELVERAKSAAQ